MVDMLPLYEFGITGNPLEGFWENKFIMMDNGCTNGLTEGRRASRQHNATPPTQSSRLKIGKHWLKQTYMYMYLPVGYLTYLIWFYLEPQLPAFQKGHAGAKQYVYRSL